MATASLTVNLGVLKFTYTDTEWKSLRDRFNRNALYRGPCLILNRATGLALDAGPRTKSGDHPVVWAAHAGPWQQWRISPAGGGRVEIASESSGLRLTTMGSPSDGGDVWLDDAASTDWTQRWKLEPVDDRVAFTIQSNSSRHSLDSGREGRRELAPHMWTTDAAASQQWMIVRLPLT